MLNPFAVNAFARAMFLLPGQWPPAESFPMTIAHTWPARFTTAAHSARPPNNPPASPESGAARTSRVSASASGTAEQSFTDARCAEEFLAVSSLPPRLLHAASAQAASAALSNRA